MAQNTDLEEATPFRRMVIGFYDAATATADLEIAVRLAQSFGSDLCGTFIEDASSIEWAASPLGRQFSRDLGATSPQSADQLARNLSAAAAIARRRLAKVAADLGLMADFMTTRASPQTNLSASARGDLITVIEPADPLARLSYPFAGILRAVELASSPILYVPHGTVERAGHVLAVVDADDRSIELIVRSVAGLLGENLVAIRALDKSTVADLPSGERLLILSRRLAFGDKAGSATASLMERKVPILIIGAPKTD